MPPPIDALELYPALKRRWGRQLRKSLRSVLLRQSPDWVDVQLRFRNGAERFYFLGFICAGSEPLFLPESDIVDNAQHFLHLDALTLSHCIGGLFRRAVSRRWEALLDAGNSDNDRYLCPF
ncbi:hypothetical protein [Flaviaesturariibacter aridisoli]|uniref:Uncharacterized protein n=1 Tax=Flaviaesturariibacter aridisoli TaxID=2545761 RepID=A0A4R4E4F1_9BACT|nr:hypothetical protein [Flaviaesturariibacter aridisoli]TCZ71800.1 hypothetical protein E0486_09630 [Flaviaesturariibacter aridisoli]